MACGSFIGVFLRDLQEFLNLNFFELMNGVKIWEINFFKEKIKKKTLKISSLKKKNFFLSFF